MVKKAGGEYEKKGIGFLIIKKNLKQDLCGGFT